MHPFGNLRDFDELQTLGKTMLHTGGLLTDFDTLLAKVAEVGGDGDVCPHPLPSELHRPHLCEFDTPFIERNIMFIPTSDFADMTARTILIVDQESIFLHVHPLYPFSILTA
jgi:hypothetical protein